MSKNYIITANIGYIKSYDFNENKVYHFYKKYNNNTSLDCRSLVINNNNEVLKIIESNEDGNIRIWNFHSAELLDEIKISSEWLFGICLWNNDYLFISCRDKSIKLMDLKNKTIIKTLYGLKNDDISCIKKIVHPLYGECLISQGTNNGKIKLWINKF